jgi:hypothetical protein
MSVPIGRPIANLAILIVGRDGSAMPVGAAGELWIAGTGLARGYLERPDLTAERFAPHPWARGERAYRTGDLARRLPGGEIEFLGRIDGQVKIRGFRVEPGEVEAALRACSGVREAAVVAEGEGSERRLAAYVVADSGAPLEAQALRDALRARLPEALVPSTFAFLPALPLNANGKLDRRALAAVRAERPAVPAVAPRGAVEEAIAAAWCAALGVASVSVDDNFFDLGGHSLLLVKVHRALHERFPELTVLDLFRHPTVALLARSLHRGEDTATPLAESRERGEERSERLQRQREMRRQTVSRGRRG